MRGSLAIVLLLAGCGQGEEPTRGGASANQIKQLSTPAKEEVDLQATVRIASLRPEDLAALGATACDFSRGGRIILAVTPADAVARIAGSVHHFTHSGPLGPTGGFFEDRDLSISVGRTGEVPTGEGAAGRWPGRITITNRRANQQMKLDGVWRCGT